VCLSLNFGARILPQIVASRNFSMLRLASVFPTKYSWANDFNGRDSIARKRAMAGFMDI
jgi:hypothetical protein